MVEVDRSYLATLASDFRRESQTYFRQWILWLGLGSAGGAVAFVSLASALPDPDYAFRILAFSLWAFLVGIVSASACILFSSIRSQYKEVHFSASHKRDSMRDVANRLPQLVSSPPNIADEINAERNAFVAQADDADILAEKSWQRQGIWNFLIIACQIVSGTAFVIGVAWPLVFIARGGLLVPAIN